MNNRKRNIALISIFGLATLAVVGHLAQSTPEAVAGAGQSQGTMAIPDGYTGVAVALANGTMNDISEAQNTDPDDFIDWQMDVIGRTPAEIAQHKADAFQFFADRFGITDPENDPNFLYEVFYVAAPNNYRVYAVGGVKVPSSGWVLQDGGYRLTITNPAGYTFGGEFAGVHAPFGSFVLFGDYKIERTKPNGQLHPHPFVIKFKSSRPVTALPDGTGGFQCDLDSPDFGLGLAQGFFAILPNHPFPGLLTSNTRNIMSFSDPPFNGL